MVQGGLGFRSSGLRFFLGGLGCIYKGNQKTVK